MRDVALGTLRTSYPSTKLAREAAKTLLDAITRTIHTHTFTVHTAAELSDE